MKVLTKQPWRYRTGDVLDPSALNRMWQYAQSAIDDVGSRRAQRPHLILPFTQSTETPSTQADALERRTIRIPTIGAMVIDRAYLHANLTSDDAVDVFITTDGSTPATGASTPHLTTGAASASVATTIQNFNPERITLGAGTEHRIHIAPRSGNFSAECFDVGLHFSSDRWLRLGGTPPVFLPTLWTDEHEPDATTVATSKSSLETQAAAFATRKLTDTPLFFKRETWSSASDASSLTFQIPRYDSARAEARIVGIYVYALASSAETGTNVSAVLRDESGSTLSTAVATFAASTFASGSTTAAIAMTAATSGISIDPALDYSLRFTTNIVSTAEKAYAWVFFSR